MHKGFGYTIIEVLIFVAVSGFIFVYAVGSISGQQRRVQFSQSTREFEQKIKDIMNDVTTGYYPSSDQLLCAVVSGRPSLSQQPASSFTTIGSNSECLNVGKVIQFNPEISGSSQDSKLYIYNLIGRRYSGTVAEAKTVKSIADARPVASYSTTLGPDVSIVDEAELRFGLRVTRVYSQVSGSERQFKTVAFVSNFEGSPAGSNSATSQAQVLQIGGIQDTGNVIKTQTDAVNLINTITDSGADTAEGYLVKSPSGIVICLASPYGMKASLTIGGSNSSSTQLKVDDMEAGCA